MIDISQKRRTNKALKKGKRSTRKMNGGDGMKSLGNVLKNRFLISPKFLFTRLFNPANADRILYKNAFFLELMDWDLVNKIYEPNKIEIKEECGSFYIYKAKDEPVAQSGGEVEEAKEEGKVENIKGNVEIINNLDANEEENETVDNNGPVEYIAEDKEGEEKAAESSDQIDDV